MIRYALRGLLYTGILLVLALVGVAILVQTGPGKRFLASTLSSTLSTPETGIEIADLQGWIPIEMRVGRLQLSDPDGVWLEAADIALDWSPSALFGGRVQIDFIGAKRLNLIRMPAASEEAEPPTTDPFRLPELPKSLPPITLAELTVETIDLGQAVLGEAASFSLDGSLTGSDDGRDVDLTLDLQRLDQATAFLTLTSTVNLDPQRLAIDLDAGETGNLLETLSGRTDAGDLDLSLVGEGPLVDWSGRLNAIADGLATLDAELSLALVDEPKLGIDAVLQPVGTALPADLGDLIGSGLDLTLNLIQNRAQAITLERLDIGSKSLAIAGAGTVDFEGGGLDLKATIDTPDLDAFSNIAKTAFTGEAALTLDLGGTLNEPNGVLDLRTTGLSVAGIGTSDLVTTFDWRASAPSETAPLVFDISAKGNVSGLAIPDTPLPAEDVAWNAVLRLPLEGMIDVQEATVTMADASLTTKGTIDPKTLVSDLDIRLSTEALNRLITPYVQDVDGKALIEMAVETTEQAENVIVDLSMGLSQLSGLPDGARELVGKRLDLKAAIHLDDQRHLRINDLLLTGEQATLKGGADLDLESEATSAKIEAALPHLGVLASLIEQPIEGALDLDATVEGTLASPLADLTITGDGLSVAGEPLDALSLNVTGRDLLASPQGKLNVDLNVRTLPLALAVDYHLDDSMLSLSAIDFNGPGSALDGEIEVDLDRSLIDGGLKGSFDDLSMLQPLLEQSLEGSIDLDLKLSTDDKRQDARLSIEGEGIGGDFGQIKGIDLTATIEDLLGKPRIAAETGLRGFEQETISLSRLSLRTEGDLDRLDIDLDLDGEVIELLSLKTTAALVLGDALAIDVDRLSGSFAGEDLDLKRPLRIEQGEDRLQLTGLDLRFGQASLMGEVDIGKSDVDGQFDLRSLPLALLRRFGGPEIAGIASADVDLGGTVSRPSIKTVINLNKIQTEEVTTTDLPPIDVMLRADLDDGILTGRLSASGLTQQPITARAIHPLTMQWRPFAVDMPTDSAIEGEVKAEISLARFGDLLALDGQSLEGILTTDLKLAGTIEAPLIDGPITLKNGAYENIFAGTILRDITLDAKASRDRISIAKLSARVGEDGTADANGWIDLDPEANFPLSLSLAFNEAEVVSRDDVEATLSGDLSMLGDLGDATIGGNINVRRAELQIPESSGPSLPDIDIEEIGGNIINAAKTEEVETKPFDPELDLTIDLPNKVYIRGRGLESEWEGRLRIAGTTTAPRITGNLAVKKGYFDFIEKRFEIEEGNVDFKGASPPNPILLIKAAATDGDFKAIINLDGPANAPELRLESEPVLPEDEVLARLLFDRELSEIGPVEAGKLALALNKLRGGGGFDAFGEIRNALKIDTLDIVGGEEAADSKVKAGKYLSDDVYFEVERGAGDESGRARVEIEILPNVSLEADTGEDSSGGVGLKWRFNY